MASSRPGHRASRSVGGTRTSFAVFSATDFNRMADYSPRLRFCKRVTSASIIPRTDAGFESQEPTSPQLTCIGQIKMKPKWAKASKQEAATKPTKPAKETSNNNKKLYKLKKLMLGRHHSSDNKKGTEDDEAVKVEEEKFNLSLGTIKRYTSGSYDAKFGSMFVEDSPIVTNLEAVSKEMGGINIWKRRSTPPLKALDVSSITRVDRFQLRKPLTSDSGH